MRESRVREGNESEVEFRSEFRFFFSWLVFIIRFGRGGFLERIFGYFFCLDYLYWSASGIS